MGEGKLGLAHLNGMRRDFMRSEMLARVSVAQNAIDASPPAEEAVFESLTIVPNLSQGDNRWYRECIDGLRNGADNLGGQ
jgi:hypothetical protein